MGENSLCTALNSRKIIKARKGFYELSPSEKEWKKTNTTVFLFMTKNQFFRNDFLNLS
tara:strand:+ start:1464 stop:1637 length:174 start_codon:yes stop_codon:yes gene_type:complete